MKVTIVCLVLLVSLFASGQTREPLRNSTGRGKFELYHGRPGPWGNLQYYYTYLEAPSRITDLISIPSRETKWHFPGKGIDELRTFLRDAGVPTTAVEIIFKNSLPFHTEGESILYPPDEQVIALTPESRESVYQELRRWPSNRFYYTPLLIESGSVRDHFEGTPFHPEIIGMIENLSYRIGSAIAFSDPQLVIGQFNDDVAERAFMRAMTRTRSLMLRIRVESKADFEGLKSYWSAGYKGKDVRSFFESAVLNSTDQIIDVAHLLPPTARQHLYTFPNFSMGLEGNFPDSLWASLNFFNYLPDNGISDLEKATQYIQDKYKPVTGPYTFGDLLLFKDPGTDRLVHSCIYIADNIVYTKNSRSLRSPFVLMKLEDLLIFKASAAPLGIKAWRRDVR
jgi:hypothetical protein